MRARYAGVCSRTGQSYRAGTEIVKGSRGWEIAGRSPSAATEDIRTVRTHDGKIITLDVSGGAFHRACVDAAGVTSDQIKSDSTLRARFHAARPTGSDFICPVCSQAFVHILTDDEIVAHKAEQNAAGLATLMAARHPLVAAAGIEDYLTMVRAAELHHTIVGPGLTFQYNEAGELTPDHYGVSVPLCADTPALFERAFVAHWNKYERDGAACYDRLQELVREHLAAIPDNPHAQADAWIAGILADMPEGIHQRIARIEAEIAELVSEQEDYRQREARKAELMAALQPSVVARGADPGEDGTDPYAVVEVTDPETGGRLQFRCRNIFDFGYTVNPAYAVAPGLEPGGLASAGNWQAFEHPGRGWYDVRPLTAGETMALEYLSICPPVFDGIRM